MTTPTKREEVARAMWRQCVDRMRLNGTIGGNGTLAGLAGDWPWESEGDAHHADWLAYADAAIAAMLPANAKMIEAGMENVVGCCCPSQIEVGDIFTAMIDAAGRGE